MDGRFPKLKAGFFSKKRIEWASSGEFLCFPEFVHEVLILEKDQQYVKSFFSLGFSSNAVVCTFILEACSSKGEPIHMDEDIHEEIVERGFSRSA